MKHKNSSESPASKTRNVLAVALHSISRPYLQCSGSPGDTSWSQGSVWAGVDICIQCSPDTHTSSACSAARAGRCWTVLWYLKGYKWKGSHVGNTVRARKGFGSVIAELEMLPWFRKLMAFMQAYSSLLIFNWWNLRNRYINLSITSMPSSLKLRNQTRALVSSQLLCYLLKLYSTNKEF